jgi:UDP-N-acetylglucosamine/UDP-N-acetylgalactosamine diphosphorylase
MVQIGDPFLLGCHIRRQSEMTTLAVPKRHALDRVGNIVSVDGRTQVIEYSDFPDTVAHQKNPDGSLKFWAASVAIHVFDAAFLRRASRDANALPFHVARKKVSYIDDQGTRIEPSAPNAIKFERFIFDLMPRADHALNVEGPADTWFSPVKNAPGEPSDSPETCQAAMITLHRQWLIDAGAKVAANVPVEISPLFALDAVELKQKLDKEIKQGLEITQPKYLR